MNIRSVLGAACAAVALTVALPAIAHGNGETVTPNFGTNLKSTVFGLRQPLVETDAADPRVAERHERLFLDTAAVVPRLAIRHSGILSVYARFCERLRVKLLGSTHPYVKVRGEWKYLYRAVDKEGNTVDFLLRARRNRAAAQLYFEKSIQQNGAPETVTIDKAEPIWPRCTR